MSLAVIRRLCVPAFIYFVLHAIVLAVAAAKKVNDGRMSDPDVIANFAVSVVALAFWVWILNMICRNGYTKMSWLLVIAPFIMFFVFGKRINWTPSLPLI